MNRDEYKVLVVIAYYNDGDYIRKAFVSLPRMAMDQDTQRLVHI